MARDHRNNEIGDNHLNAVSFTAGVVKSMSTYLKPQTESHGIVAEAMTDSEMHKHFGNNDDGTPASKAQIVQNVKRFHGDVDSMYRDQYSHNTDIDMPDRSNPHGTAHYYED
jgi:hypothetical protein